MAKPVKHTFETSKKHLTELFPPALKTQRMHLIGCHKRLGLISFRQRSGLMLYAHIVETKNGKTQVSIAPGLSYLGEREQTEVPESKIKDIMQKLENIIKNNNK